MQRAANIILLVLLAGLSVSSLAYASDAEPKRVLLILFYRQGVPWSDRIADSLRENLAVKSPHPVDLNIEYADRGRHPDDAYLQKLIEIYRHKYAHPPMHVVIGVGDEAADILIEHGEAVFGKIPMVIVSANPRILRRDFLKSHMTSALWGPDIRGNVELIEALLPKTRHLFVVSGSSVTDREAEKLARTSLRQYGGPFEINYISDISQVDLLEKVARLPENSALLYLAFTRDTRGADFIPREMLALISSKANAPVFGIIDPYLGFGIVGGSLLSAANQGKRCADITARILSGERPADINPARSLNQLMFDWRQLKRWGIPEDRLPPGSSVRFKTYYFWDRYRWYIVAALFLILVQSGLISFLLRQRVQRRRAQVQLAERLRFEKMLSALSARFVNLLPDRVDAEIKRVLESISTSLELDRVSVFEISEADQKLHLVHSHKETEIAAPPSEIQIEQLPWASQKLINGELLVFSDPEDLPAEAGVEKNFLRAQGIISVAAIPLSTGEKTLGLLSLAMLRHRKKWPHELIRQCRLIAEVFANAMVRKQHEESLMQAEAKYRTVADFTYDWEYWANVDDTIEYVSPSCERISGYTARDFIDNPSLFKEIIVPEDRDIWDRHYHDSRQELKPREIQFRIQRRDGQIRWIEHSCQPVTDRQGRLQGFRASNRDITERKRSEKALVQSKDFNQSILNSLKYRIAVLDKEGNILEVNQSWQQFARENNAGSLDRLGHGISYLDVCGRSSDTGDESARTALEGIQTVLAGTRDEFAMEYPCDSPAEKRWFLMRVTPFSGRKGGAIISHSDISERKLAEIDLRMAYTDIEQLKNQLEAETAYLQAEIKLEHNFESIIGNSAALQYVLYKIEQVATADTAVLVLGETGTGKELVARAIHDNSLRRARPLVKVNCAALPSNLIESELFGHERGAFTGAQTWQAGRFEVAAGTSIFLDEIGELPPDLQTKLLQVLQDGEFERLGSSRTIKDDVRVIAATNRDLEKEVSRGGFREDLFYRLNVFPITVPPLRQRAEDIPLLAQFFVERVSKRLGKTISQIPVGIMQQLQDYPWPGNVRELENVIERAVINSSGPKLHLADDLTRLTHKELPTTVGSLEENERNHIVRVLEQTRWRIDGPEGAARILDINPSTLRSRMRKLGIQKP